MKTEYKYIYFDEMKLPRKTKTFLVRNKTSNDLLGCVKWYAPWRRYCYVTGADIVLDADCLADIRQFITELMKERKEEMKK